MCIEKRYDMKIQIYMRVEKDISLSLSLSLYIYIYMIFLLLCYRYMFISTLPYLIMRRLDETFGRHGYTKRSCSKESWRASHWQTPRQTPLHYYWNSAALVPFNCF